MKILSKIVENIVLGAIVTFLVGIVVIVIGIGLVTVYETLTNKDRLNLGSTSALAIMIATPVVLLIVGTGTKYLDDWQTDKIAKQAERRREAQAIVLLADEETKNSSIAIRTPYPTTKRSRGVISNDEKG